jgi:hypothetical protein
MPVPDVAPVRAQTRVLIAMAVPDSPSARAHSPVRVRSQRLVPRVRVSSPPPVALVRA